MSGATGSADNDQIRTVESASRGGDESSLVHLGGSLVLGVVEDDLRQPDLVSETVLG